MKQTNCAFQYAKMSNGIFRNTKIVCDKTELTIDEAILLWEGYYSDAAKWIADGGSVEMVIWINMKDSSSYGDHLHYISADAESDGTRIWVTQKHYFPSKPNPQQTA